MKKKTARLPKIADPTIEKVFEDFLAEQKKRLKPETVAGYEEIIELLTDSLNGYGHQWLSSKEETLFEKLYNAEGKEQREFCQIFGPDKIVDSFGEFLGYFMIRKVMAGGETLRMSGTVTKKLSKWLAAKGYISEEEAMEGAEDGAAAARDLPLAEQAAEILYAATRKVAFNHGEVSDEDYLDFDHYCITKVEPGKLWLEKDGAEIAGPVIVPKEATELLREDWDISCSLARVKGKWRMVEVANVYPL